MQKLEYIKEFYGLDFHIGQRVVALEKPGTTTGGTHYVHVRLDGEKTVRRYHPTEVKPEPAHTDCTKKPESYFFEIDEILKLGFEPEVKYKLCKLIRRVYEEAEKAGSKTGVELERFIRNERRICWEAEYQNGEFCIGENKVREFFNRTKQLKEGK